MCPRGILAPAAVGLAIIGLLIFAGVEVFLAARKVAAASEIRYRQQVAAAEQEGRDSILKYAGWTGAVRLSAGAVSVCAIDDNSPMSRMIRDDLTTPGSIIVVMADTLPGSPTPRFDASSLRLEFSDGRVVNALDAGEVLRTSHGVAAGAIRRLECPNAGQGGHIVNGILCLIPAELSLRNVTSVMLTIDGKPTRVPGRVFTADERSAAFNQAMSAADARAE